jgi:hypothetical protein
MSTSYPSQHVRPLLSPHEAMARELIVDRVERRRVPRPVRRHTRTALVLRRLAARLDPEVGAEAGTRQGVGGACPGSVHPDPRPWNAARRPASARH